MEENPITNSSENEKTQSRVELSVLWTKAHPVVFAFIRSTVRDFHRSEDILQEVASTVAEKFDQFNRERPFVPWALGIARNKVLVYLRKATNDRHIFDDTTIKEIAAAHGNIEGELSDMHSALESCVEKVQGISHKVLEMRYVRQQTPTAIANAVGMTANAVTVMLFRIRQALKKCVERQLAMEPGRTDIAQGGR